MASSLWCYGEEEIKITKVEKEYIDGDLYSLTTIQFKNLDGYYNWYYDETLDFITWKPAYIYDIDYVGDLTIRLRIRQNRHQNWDKTYKPTFWKISIVRIGPSSEISSEK